ncbi:hypothetical protein [Rhizobium lentis]|uniref:hypothetical protein n=1 Tax=Rhizobium lentis TaxID=1138194 RepID=UPI001C82A1D2|nr:hypothetical protein [Rhizobium lentis]MBX5046982.1 hypothetical protein [Rhizobium lentis]MBX5058994.1 hypothetical protein [Rhizobium lentis]
MNRKVELGNNDHEKLIAAYCRNSFSAAGLFHPTPRKKTGEPADLALKAGRTLFLFWMQESKQWFDASCKHNLDQAAKHLPRWKDGLAIRGGNEFRDFEIKWSDIDNFAVISVVDGKEQLCCAHPLDYIGHREKLSAVVTVSGTVLKQLAYMGGGARELGMICSHLHAVGSRSTADLLKDLSKLRASLENYAWDKRPVRDEEKSFYAKDSPEIIEGFGLVRAILFALKRGLETKESERFSDALCQIGWLERYSLTAFVAEFAARIWAAEADNEGLSSAYFDEFSSPLRFGVAVGNVQRVAEMVPEWLIRSRERKLAFQLLFTTDFRSLATMVAIGETPAAVLDSEMRALRLSFVDQPAT